MPKSDSGPKKPRGRMVFNARVVLVTAVAVTCALVWVALDSDRKGAEAETGTRTPEIADDSSREKQRVRSEFIDGLITSGVIERIDRPVKQPHVYVADGWRLLDDDQKHTALGVVLAYYDAKDARVEVVIVRDAATGERIGMFSRSGLELD